MLALWLVPVHERVAPPDTKRIWARTHLAPVGPSSGGWSVALKWHSRVTQTHCLFTWPSVAYANDRRACWRLTARPLRTSGDAPSRAICEHIGSPRPPAQRANVLHSAERINGFLRHMLMGAGDGIELDALYAHSTAKTNVIGRGSLRTSCFRLA